MTNRINCITQIRIFDELCRSFSDLILKDEEFLFYFTTAILIIFDSVLPLTPAASILAR